MSMSHLTELVLQLSLIQSAHDVRASGNTQRTFVDSFSNEYVVYFSAEYKSYWHNSQGDYLFIYYDIVHVVQYDKRNKSKQ